MTRLLPILLTLIISLSGSAFGDYFENDRSSLAPKSGVGDLTKTELDDIQKVVNEAGRPAHVVGSAAKGTRRGIGTDLPVGKGPGTKSDIDILLSPSSKDNFTDLSSKLPSSTEVNCTLPNYHRVVLPN